MDIFVFVYFVFVEIKVKLHCYDWFIIYSNYVGHWDKI